MQIVCTVRIRAPQESCHRADGGVLPRSQKNTERELFTVLHRQTIEIPHVNPKSLKKIEKSLEKNGTPIGSERDEIVNIIACPGIERCKFANIDTINLAQKIDQKLFGKEMPGKNANSDFGVPERLYKPNA